MEIIAYQKFIRVTARKLRLVADAVRADKPAQALVKLQFMHKQAASDLYKVLKQAIANAKTRESVKESDLIFKHILIEEGPRYKRLRAASRGRGRTVLKRTSHIKIVLDIKETKLSTELETKTEKTEVKKIDTKKITKTIEKVEKKK